MINEVGKKGLDKYLDFCARHGNIDIDKARITTRAAIRNHNKPDSDKSEMVEMDNLMGHFNEYYHGGVTYTKPQMNRLFNKTMKKWGYEKIATKCWNGRPAFWRKIENNTVLHFTDA
jgi:hypothetical protein